MRITLCFIHFKTQTTAIMLDKETRTIRTEGNLEIWTFQVPRSAKRIRKHFQLSDEWMPMFFSRQYEGKRIKSSRNTTIKQGQVGVSYKAQLYKITQSFDIEKFERFEITSVSFDADQKIGRITIAHKPCLHRNPTIVQQIIIGWVQKEGGDHTEVTVAQPKLTSFYSTLKFGRIFQIKSKSRQYRDECCEDLQLYLSH